MTFTEQNTPERKLVKKAKNKAAITVEDLVADGFVNEKDIPTLNEVAKEFKVRVSGEMRQAIDASGDIKSPIARQFIPDEAELLVRNDELLDPIGDEPYSPVNGITHRYPDRVLLVATHICEVYCRFCFRRETVGETGHLDEEELSAAIAYINSNSQIWEVVLTGGDPLVLAPRRLVDIMRRLAEIEHLEVVRFHTRVPVVAPEKITAELIAALKRHPSVYVVVHTNHLDELTPRVQDALAMLVDNGIPLLSQTVLLKGVNNSPEALTALFRGLIKNRVKPYYLHHTDLARGTSHFRTTVEEGQRLMAALRGNISGICQPTYVLDIPGGKGKVPIGHDYIRQTEEIGTYIVEDYRGNMHEYRDISANIHN